MKLIGASAIITCDTHFNIIRNGGILFDESKILEIGDFETLRLENQHIESRFYESCAITPAFINAHIHFEFSKNIASLQYGNFGEWLNSVMEKRESLLSDMQDSLHQTIKETLSCGVACVGTISSAGLDIEALHESPLKVMLFNEIMGTNEQYLEKARQGFDERLQWTMSLKNDRFSPAIALHSPYSLHYKLAQHALNQALKHRLLLSTHFLESKEELAWLTSNEGYFAEFFRNFFHNEHAKPFYTKESFLELFENVECLFVHCLFANNDDLEKLSRLKADIVSCPRSNRLLNNKYFDFLKARDYELPLIIATDGKSSNNSISILDEAKAALFAYEKLDLQHLAKEILLSITARPAKRLLFNNGILEKNKASDFAIFHNRDIKNIPDTQLALHVILHAVKVQDLYINGERIDIENY